MDPFSLEVGELVTAEFLVAEARLAVDRRGQNYYSLKVNCVGGRSVDAKVWSDNIGAPLQAGQGIEALARVDEYMGRLQLSIQRYSIVPADQFDVSQYVRTADVDVDAAFETLFNWERDEFTSPWFKPLMLDLHGNAGFAREFKTSPAASAHHHNYMGGLAEHTLDVWELVDRLCLYYGDQMDRELALCGAALHDIGKIKSYSLASGVSRHTDVGSLLNHIFISASMVSNLWDRVVTEDVVGDEGERAARDKSLLLHVVLSHHGKRDWGSPVIPQTPEALTVHIADQTSATMHTAFEALRDRPEGEPWTDWVAIMDDRRKLFGPPQ